MGWETWYHQGSLLPKSGHNAVPVRLPFSSSLLPPRFSLSQPLTVCVLSPRPLPFTEGSGVPRGSQLWAHQGAAGSSSGRGNSSSSAKVSSFTGGWGGRQRPQLCLAVGRVDQGPGNLGPALRLRCLSRAGSLGVSTPHSVLRFSCAAVGCCVRGPGEGWGRDCNAFFLRG